jgi:hypothetical protein
MIGLREATRMSFCSTPNPKLLTTKRLFWLLGGSCLAYFLQGIVFWGAMGHVTKCVGNVTTL